MLTWCSHRVYIQPSYRQLTHVVILLSNCRETGEKSRGKRRAESRPQHVSVVVVVVYLLLSENPNGKPCAISKGLMVRLPFSVASGMQITEALRVQLDVQRRLHEQLEVVVLSMRQTLPREKKKETLN
jgi:hypothetical protein